MATLYQCNIASSMRHLVSMYRRRIVLACRMRHMVPAYHNVSAYQLILLQVMAISLTDYMSFKFTIKSIKYIKSSKVINVISVLRNGHI